MPKGKIENPDRARQLIQFGKMQVLKNGRIICPTDLDGIYDIGGRIWILYEVKYGNAPLSAGQELLISNFIRMVKDSGRHGLALVVSHEVDDVMTDVELADCIVKRIYCTQKADGKIKWMKPKTPDQTAYEVTMNYINYCETDINIQPLEVRA